MRSLVLANRGCGCTLAILVLVSVPGVVQVTTPAGARTADQQARLAQRDEFARQFTELREL